MNIIEKDIRELREYQLNPRNNEEAVTAVANSIREFGFKVPIIIDKDDVIVAGHTRLKAAMMLEMTTVPCIVADDLTDEQVKAFRLADNKVAELSGWNFDLLDAELKEIGEIDMSQFGFDLSAIENTAEAYEDDFDEDSDINEHGVERGQVWALGNHRLMCGDSADKNDADILMGGCWQTSCSRTRRMAWR